MTSTKCTISRSLAAIYPGSRNGKLRPGCRQCSRSSSNCSRATTLTKTWVGGSRLCKSVWRTSRGLRSDREFREHFQSIVFAVPVSSMQMTAFELLVKAVRRIFGVFILVGTPPHLVPEMQCISLRGKRGGMEVDKPAPLERTDGTKHSGRMDAALQPVVCNQRSEE